MDKVKEKLDAIKITVEQTIGNVKGGVVSPTDAVNDIHKLYEDFIDKIRYPNEPPVHTRTQTQQDILLQQHFKQ
ncbi:MAG TPA: hypothetical protein PK431_01570 [Chitinophagales bacterium]|nr:hypothetical protein [Chitinophagales bacterium]